MIVKELYNLMEKEHDDNGYWEFIIYVDGISDNIHEIYKNSILHR